MGRRARVAAAMAMFTAALAVAVPARADIAPPYVLSTSGANALSAAPAGGSTLAISVRRTAAGVEFSPAPVAGPATGCDALTPGALTLRCDATSVAAGLTLAGDIVQVEVLGVGTQLLRIDGGDEADAITVEGPLPVSPEAVAKLELLSGAGADAITVSGRVAQITDDATAADDDDDRYTITSTSITVAGTISSQGGDDLIRTADPDLSVDAGEGNDTLLGPGALDGGRATTRSSRRAPRRSSRVARAPTASATRRSARCRTSCSSARRAATCWSTAACCRRGSSSSRAGPATTR